MIRLLNGHLGILTFYFALISPFMHYFTTQIKACDIKPPTDRMNIENMSSKMATVRPGHLDFFKKVYRVYHPFINIYFTTQYKQMISNHLQATDKNVHKMSSKCIWPSGLFQNKHFACITPLL